MQDNENISVVSQNFHIDGLLTDPPQCVPDAGIVEIIGELVVVVDENDGDHRPGAQILVAGLQELGAVDPKQLGDGLGAVVVPGHEAQGPEAPLPLRKTAPCQLSILRDRN